MCFLFLHITCPYSTHLHIQHEKFLCHLITHVRANLFHKNVSWFDQGFKRSTFEKVLLFSGSARSRNLEGALEGQHIFFGGRDRISRNLQPPPPFAKIFDPLNPFSGHIYIPKRNFFPNISFFPRSFKIVPANQNFSHTYKNVTL